jgi:DinB family protein
MPLEANMLFRVGIENNNEGNRSVAWALEHFGCFAYGKDGDSAMAALPAAIRAYSVWIGQHEPSWLRIEKFELNVDEVWENYYVNDQFERTQNESDYMVDSWFQYDWKPLTAEDIERATKLLIWSRADLLKIVEGLSPERLDQKHPDERRTINGILNHIGGAEWWYMDCLGLAFPKDKLPKDPIKRLEKVRAYLMKTLPKLKGVKQVLGVNGEFWSPRKVLRRAVWHERDHTAHIRKLV